VTFEIQVRYSTPLTPLRDVDQVLKEFLVQLGYLPEGEPPERSVAYRLVRGCLLRNPERLWYAEELLSVLKTSKPTLYRHLNKLKTLDLLEEVSESRESARGRKGYRLRYGNLSRAWDFVEANAQNALKRYRETVDHLQGLLEEERRSPRTSKDPDGRLPPVPASPR
jgi:predicted transcriptional regulator